MKTLDAESRLDCARAAVGVLRGLKLKNERMRYNELARAIGLMTEEEEWRVWHRQQIADILNLAAAAERQVGANSEYTPIEFERIVGADGEPGAGAFKTRRVVTGD